MLIAYIGLGSNVASRAGSPAQTVLAAMESLASLGDVIARSSLYETAPVGYVDQPAFINAAVAVRISLDPERLLDALLTIEREYGRDRGSGVPKGPRTLDLDLLLIEDASGNGLLRESQTLTLPHPAIAERRFVLAPLAEIAPELRHPILRRTIRELLAKMPQDTRGGAVRMLPMAPV